MNLEELKNIINQYKNKFLLNSKAPWIFKQNQLLFKEVNNKYNNLFKSTMEIIYLIKNYDNLENLHIFCYCGKKSVFKNIYIGYGKYCSKKCKANSIEWKEHLKSKDFINKMKNKLLQKYNVINVYQLKSVKDKIKNKLLQKYGVTHNTQVPGNREKAKQTCLQKYGVKHYFQTQQYKNQYKDNNFVVNSQKKRYNSLKKNHTFHISHDEEQVYNYLLNKFNENDIERQYKSNLYTFASDFYIKSLNLYIECHFGFTHNRKPFKNSVENLQELQKLKEKANEINFKSKTKDYYKNVIYTWTDLDIRKLNTFKQNKLNYKIFYNIKQFLSWYNKI